MKTAGPGATQKTIGLMYHEVIADALAAGAAFRGADIYKISERAFRAQAEAIRGAIGAKPIGRVDDPAAWRENAPLFLTFDDGEASAYTLVADLLESQGWRGHFFITTDWIGRPGVLTRAQIRELARRGHVIGSHSKSHPVRMALCSARELRTEWGESVKALADILGSPIRTGSVPGGYYSRSVADAAVEAGVRFLFNSNPTMAIERAEDCLVLGRYAVRRGMSAATVAGIASGHALPRWSQMLAWKIKGTLKGIAGDSYLTLRSRAIPTGLGPAAELSSRDAPETREPDSATDRLA